MGNREGMGNIEGRGNREGRGNIEVIGERECKKNSKNRKVGEILKVWGNREGRAYKERVGK